VKGKMEVTMMQSQRRPQRGRPTTAGTGRRRMLATAAAGAVGLFSASAGVSGAQSPIQDELHIITARLAPGLDPTHEFSDAIGTYLRSDGAAEALLRVTPQAEVDVDLASAYEMLDPFTWQVTLRPNARFWSGRPVDATAVVESLERSRALAAPAAALLVGMCYANLASQVAL
jgi:peptide/nickel transport system substrate-binding protein